MGIRVFSLPISLMMIYNICALYLIIIIKTGDMNHLPLFRVRSWNKDARCTLVNKTLVNKLLLMWKKYGPCGQTSVVVGYLDSLSAFVIYLSLVKGVVIRRTQVCCDRTRVWDNGTVSREPNWNKIDMQLFTTPKACPIITYMDRIPYLAQRPKPEYNHNGSIWIYQSDIGVEFLTKLRTNVVNTYHQLSVHNTCRGEAARAPMK